MKIVHVITRLIVGGAQENTLLSCEGQHDLGHDVTLITGPALGPEGSLMERATSYGYKVEVIDEMRRAIKPVLDWRTYRRLRELLRDIKPEDFAEEYDPMQVSAHKDAVSLFERYANGGDDAKLKDWAGKTLAALKHHLEMAQTLDKNRK